jgi:hypothetical protein
MALSADRQTPGRDGVQFEYPCTAGVTCYAGALIVLDAAGNAKPGTVAAGEIPVGRCDELADNSGGGAAAINVKVSRGIHRWNNSSIDPVTKANIGDTVYVEDDQTVRRLIGASSPAGIMIDIDSLGVWVDTSVSTALVSGLTAANNLSDVGAAATARANIAANLVQYDVVIANLVAADAKVYRIPVNVAGTITKIRTVLSEHALAVGDATITASIGGVPVTNGVVTITQAGSAPGDKDTATPTAARTVVVGDTIELTVGGANTDASAIAYCSLRIET